MSTDSLVRAKLKTLLEGVANIGNVHDYWRWSALYGDNEFFDIAKSSAGGTDYARLWMISCTGIGQTDPVGDEYHGVPTLRQYAYAVRGYHSLNDANATEKSFLALTESVMNTLDENLYSIGDLANVMNVSTPQLSIFDARMFGSVLCHFAEITLTVTITGRGTG